MYLIAIQFSLQSSWSAAILPYQIRAKDSAKAEHVLIGSEADFNHFYKDGGRIECDIFSTDSIYLPLSRCMNTSIPNGTADYKRVGKSS